MFGKYKNRNACRDFTIIDRGVVVMASAVASLRSGFGSLLNKLLTSLIILNDAPKEMKVSWPKPDKSKFVLAASMLLIAAIVMLEKDFTKAKVKSEKDLITIEGKLLYYNFTKGIKGYRNYELRLRNYTNTFKITADFIKHFRKSSFEEKAYTLDKINFSIAKRDSILLNAENNKKVFIFGLSSGDEKYLDELETIKQHNSRFTLYAALILLVLSGLLFYFGFKKKNN